MTAKDFRRIVLGLEGAIEASHMGHPDFRVNGKIFATLRDGDTLGMVTLPPEEQARFVREHPQAFVIENGAWGRQGSTRVLLEFVDEEALGEAATIAWRRAVDAAAAKRTKPAAKRTSTEASTPKTGKGRAKRSAGSAARSLKRPAARTSRRPPKRRSR